MIVVGIDPGLKGGYAILSDGGALSASPLPIIGGEVAVRELMDEISMLGPPDMIVIERVHSMPAQGVASTFTFGKNYGRLTGMVEGAGWPLLLVNPPDWKKLVLRGTAKDKAAACAYVRQRYPNVQLIQPRCRVEHDGIADAVCIAEWGLKSL